MVSCKRKLQVGFVLSLLSLERSAIAQASGLHDVSRERPFGTTEVGIGFLELPSKEVCTNRTIFACKRGDTTPMFEAWQFFRLDPRFAFGAGFTIALFPLTDAPKVEPPGIHRDHKRGYFLTEMAGRYYWVTGPVWEAWVGLNGGLVVLSDSYNSRDITPDKVIAGPNGVAIRTEGYTLGLATGVSVSLSDTWRLGLSASWNLWSLPNKPGRDTLGDEASITGRLQTLILALDINYRTWF